MSWWHGGPRVKTWSQFVLWYLSSRASCLSSLSLSLEYCCSARGHECWDSLFSISKCCGHETWTATSAGLGRSCWAGAYTFERCCLGPHDSSCWDPHGDYTYETCCAERVASSGIAVNFTALVAEVGRRGQCHSAPNLPKCKALWQTGLQVASSVSNKAVRDVALYLINSWKNFGSLHNIAKRSPAFVVSVLLYGAIALVDDFIGQPTVPPNMWSEVQELVALYRENIPDITAAEMALMHILDLDLALHARVKTYYNDALQKTLEERITDANEIASDVFGDATSHSFFSAFRELSQVLTELSIEFVPIQGTLISLIRYGGFPAGRLSEGKEDVVDNDAEVMILLNSEQDFESAGARLSLALEARGWPPCTNPHPRKFVCLSMRHAIPCKLEIYAFTKDKEEGIIFAERWCSAPGQCEYNPTFPFQHWRGRMPFDIIFPLRRCRVGSLPVRIPCPNRPLHLLRGWNKGEYQRQSYVAPTRAGEDGAVQWQQSFTDDVIDKEASCLALPVVSKDRDMGDVRNQKLEREGLTMLDLYLLHSYARALHARGFASFHKHLKAPACVRRQWRIFYGEPRAELSRL